jgi:fatty-acyl-CoA synthase
VLFSHRSTVLHALASSLPDVKALSAQSVVLPVVPMFHVNAWGIPYAAPLVGAKLVFPGAALDGKSLHELFESERVTFTAGVPTVWLGLVDYMKQHGLRLSTLETTLIGGSACPAALMRALQDDYGVRVLHAWGMTEMSPVGTTAALKAKHATLTPEERFERALKQGRPPYGVDMKIVDAEGHALPHDGKTQGMLYVRGPWIAERYFRDDARATVDGWFPTGDVGTVDADGFLQITDRAKDVIKSGGEWISSIALENIAVGHPGVMEAAVIGVPHAKWGERPLLVVVTKPGLDVTREALLEFYRGRVAKWSIPDDVAFVDALPHTATGKLAKRVLREQFRDYRFPQRATASAD